MFFFKRGQISDLNPFDGKGDKIRYAGVNEGGMLILSSLFTINGKEVVLIPASQIKTGEFGGDEERLGEDCLS